MVDRHVDFWAPPRHETATAPPSRARPVARPLAEKLFRERTLFVSSWSKRLVDALMLAAILALLAWYFDPGLLLSTTTTTGGDTAAHIYTPWYLREHLLPKGLISGWSPGWYAGFPLLHFYFPLISTMQAVASFLIPYEVAFKLGTVLGAFFLPLAVYLLLRLLRFEFPTPIVGAVLSLGYLFMDSHTIYGGNIASSLVGEYSYSLSLGLCLVFIGLAYRLAFDDHARPLLAATVLALAVLTHLVTVVIVVLFLPVLVYWSIRARGWRRTAARFGPVLGLAFALTAFWSVPFLVRLGYATDMHWAPVEGWEPVLPRELWLYLAGAVAGWVAGAFRRDRRLLVLLVPGVYGLLLYFTLPEGHVWNGRFMPFWYLGVFLSCAYFVGTMLPSIARLLWRRRSTLVALGTLAALLVAMGAWIRADKNVSFLDEWLTNNYEGYEGRDDYPTFRALMQALDDLPPGRVLWEPSPDLAKYGSTVALMSIPYWTGQPTMEGIYFEASLTTPFHFLTASEIADDPSNPIRKLPYHGFDLSRGVRHMELFNVAYYVTFSDRARDAAVHSDDLRHVDDVDEFSIFALDSPGQVVVPEYEPVVLEDADWVDTNVEWFGNTESLEVPLVRRGPEEWARVSDAEELPRRPLPRGGSSIEAEVDDDEIRFETDAVGIPHWVKTSYFPNWAVEGAEGPYLASPSLMMVVPTQEEVRLYYRRTWAEWLGLALTVAALGALAIPLTRRRLVGFGTT